MNKTLLIKFGSIALVALLILLPLQMIKNKISERAFLRSSATQSVAASWTGEQTVSGPIIVLSYKERVGKRLANGSGFIFDSDTPLQTRTVRFTPEALNISAKMSTNLLQKGIYPIPVYTTAIEFSGSFDSKELIATTKRLRDMESVEEILPPVIAWRVSDPRGIDTVSTVAFGGSNYSMEPGTPASWGRNGLQQTLPLESIGILDEATFRLDLTLRGMQRLAFAPLAKTSNIELASDWPHPSFNGAFLPTQRSITDDGFTASWRVNEFASNAVTNLRDCYEHNCETAAPTALGVSLVDPVDIYLQSERAVKYGFLFVALIFIAFFTFELLARLKIHPVQYSLVGAAIAVFFLLLISLAEHLGFSTAYAASAAASLIIIASYLRAVLPSLQSTAWFCGGLGCLYWLLYIILKSEDYALLMGSLLCFMVLAMVMLLTRKIDWYDFGRQ